ncbi:MAG: pantetheine-phosphate adenylyltransferase [Clostridia bacterium]|nr:pantetheine-phosphate adenylyltransferase [Clostridia bacterium]
MKTKALVSGSFDPVTLGHIDVIKRASKLFDEVFVVVFNNTEKKFLFTLEERKKMLELSCKKYQNVIVDVCDGLLADYTEKHQISVIVRGIRDASDASYEIMLSTINRKLGNSPDTIFVPSKPEFFHVSSSYVKDMIKYHQPLSDIIPEEAIKFISEIKR